MHNQRDEQIVFLKDLLFAALYQWRKILVAAVAFALLLGGWKFAAGLPAKSTAFPQEPPANTQLREQVQAQREYMQNAPLMTIDSRNGYRAVLTLGILPNLKTAASSQNTGYISAVLKTYETRIIDITVSKEFADLVGTESRYASELVSIATQSSGLTDGAIVITMRHSDEQIVEKMLQHIAQKLPDVTKELVRDGIYYSTVLSQTIFQKQDTELQTLQDNQQKHLAALEEQLIKETVSTASTPTGSMSVALKNGIIFAIIGGILGVFLVVCLFWANHILSNRVYSARTLTAWTGLKVLGCVEGKQRKNPVDRWLRTLEGRSDASHLEITAANVRNYSAREEKLLISADGTVPEALVNTIAAGAQTQVCGLLTQDVAALEALPGCSGVLFVLQCGHSRYHDVLRQLEMVKDQNKNILGCVLVDG